MLPWHCTGSRFKGRSSELEAKDVAPSAALPWVSHLTLLSLCLHICKMGPWLPRIKIRPDSHPGWVSSVPSGHEKVHWTCRCAEPCPQRSWLRCAARPTWISSPGAGTGRTCWMSSSSCSRCSREMLYCSSRTSAKYSVLLIDSFSFTVRMMSCQAQRGIRVTWGAGWPSCSGTEQGGLPWPSLCSLVQLGGEKPASLGPLPTQAAKSRQAACGTSHGLSGLCNHCSPQGSSTGHMPILSCFTWKAEATCWWLMPIFKVSRFILSVDYVSSTAYQTESHHLPIMWLGNQPDVSEPQFLPAKWGLMMLVQSGWQDGMMTLCH